MKNSLRFLFLGAILGLFGSRLPAQVTPAAANPGQTVTFTATLTAGSPPLAYQWRKNGTAIPGATSVTYVITGVKATDAGTYDFTVSNSAGSATSNQGILSINSAPVITQQPITSQMINLGSPAIFSVVATSMPAPAYQWRKNGVPVPGATAASYTISSVSLADAANYDCVITNAAGSVTSTPCALSAASVIPAGASFKILISPISG
jgi:hypothetical protein